MQKLPVCLIAQSSLTLCNPMYCSPPNSSISGLSFPCPGDLPNPGIETRSPTLQLDSLPSKSSGKSQNSDNFHKYSMSRRGSTTFHSTVGCAQWFPPEVHHGTGDEQESSNFAVEKPDKLPQPVMWMHVHLIWCNESSMLHLWSFSLTFISPV